MLQRARNECKLMTKRCLRCTYQKEGPQYNSWSLRFQANIEFEGEDSCIAKPHTHSSL